MKKLNMVFSTALLAATLGFTAYAKDEVKEVPNHPQLTEEQKAEVKQQFEADYKEMQEKFNQLTDDQKEEIYELYDKVNVAKVKLLDKYVELELMTEEEVEDIQKHMAEMSEKNREEKQFIGFKAPCPAKQTEKTN